MVKMHNMYLFIDVCLPVVWRALKAEEKQDHINVKAVVEEVLD